MPALPCGMGFSQVDGHDRLSYREWAGFSVIYDFDDTTPVTVNPFLGHSPHVLYTNCAEPLLRWKFAELGFALVHAACVAAGRPRLPDHGTHRHRQDDHHPEGARPRRRASASSPTT